jgi:hypothetical protein
VVEHRQALMTVAMAREVVWRISTGLPSASRLARLPTIIPDHEVRLPIRLGTKRLEYLHILEL